MRHISDTARSAGYSQETDQIFLDCVEINHVDLASPLRFVHNTENIVSGGETYYAAFFKYDPPDDLEGQLRPARLSIDCVDRSIIQTVRSITGAPTFKCFTILADSPDVIEGGVFEFVLRNVKYDKHILSGDLYDEIESRIALPADVYNPNDFPGLYV